MSTERTMAQSAAASDWRFLKSQVRYWQSWKMCPRENTSFAGWVAEMRNAWVAYHAGAPWMHPGQSAMVRMAQNNARLRAEVERLRLGIDRAMQFAQVREMANERAGYPMAAAAYANMAERLNALAREDGEG